MPKHRFIPAAELARRNRLATTRGRRRQLRDIPPYTAELFAGVAPPVAVRDAFGRMHTRRATAAQPPIGGSNVEG